MIIQKTGSNAVVSLQLQTTTDLSVSFTNHGEPVGIKVDLPGDQHFLRIRALGPQSVAPITPRLWPQEYDDILKNVIITNTSVSAVFR